MQSPPRDRFIALAMLLVAMALTSPGFAGSSGFDNLDEAIEISMNRALEGGADQEPDEEEEATPSPEDDQAAIAEALANPLSYLWLLFTQNDSIRYDGDALDLIGEDAQQQNTFLLQPVASIQLTEKC